MGKFLYYVPNARCVDSHQAVAAGLEHLAGCRTESRALLGPGPDGQGGGCLFVALWGDEVLDTGEPVEYHADDQVWEEAVEGKAWLGYTKDRKPGPDDLKKPKGLRGHAVTLYGGCEWIVPVARNVGGTWALPQTIKVDARGNLRYDFLPEHAALRDGMDAAWAFITVQTDLPYIVGMRLCAELLGLHYAVGLPEISLLGLITTDNIVDVCVAACDIPDLRAVQASVSDQKKTDGANTLDGSATGNGSPDSTPDTSPPDATSSCSQSSEGD